MPKYARYALVGLCLSILLSAFSLQLPAQSEVSAMQSNERVIREFIATWSSLNAEELSGYFTEDGTYFNIPTQPVTGRENIKNFITCFIRPWQATEWEALNLLASETMVIVERIDHTTVVGKSVDLPYFGIFEMENGKIKVWRDYFDLATYTTALTAAMQTADN